MPLWVSIAFLFVSTMEGAGRGAQWVVRRKLAVQNLFLAGMALMAAGVFVEVAATTVPLTALKDVLEAIFGISLLGLGLGCILAGANFQLMYIGWMDEVVFASPTESLLEAVIAFLRTLRDYWRTR